MNWGIRVELTEAAAFAIFDSTIPVIETGFEDALDKATARAEWMDETMERLETLMMASS